MKRRTDPFGAPLVWLMDGRTVVTEFMFAHGRWSEVGGQSKAQFQYLRRRAEELRGLPYQERATIHHRDDKGHVGRRSHLVQLIGDEPFKLAYRREWDGLLSQQIPGYREVYDFGRGCTFRSEKIFSALDSLRDAGVFEVQLSTLRKIIDRQTQTETGC